MANVIQGPSVSYEKIFAAKHDEWHVEIAIFHAAAKQQSIKKETLNNNNFAKASADANDGSNGVSSYESHAAP